VHDVCPFLGVGVGLLDFGDRRAGPWACGFLGWAVGAKGVSGEKGLMTRLLGAFAN
jgi:hypothetical protein